MSTDLPWAAVPGLGLEVTQAGHVRTVARPPEPSRELVPRRVGDQILVDFGGPRAVDALVALAWPPPKVVVPKAPEKAEEVLKDFVSADEGVTWSKAKAEEKPEAKPHSAKPPKKRG